MGTNYYITKNGPSVRTPIHIGKSSIGWLFLFQAQNETWYDPPVVWNTWPQVRDWLRKYTVESKDFVIIDEYDEVIPYDEFVKMVERKQVDPRDRDNPDNFSHARNIDGYRFEYDDFS